MKGGSQNGATRRVRPVADGVDLRCQAVLPVLGVPMVFETNSPEALAAVHESFGAWSAPAPDGMIAPWTGRVRLVVRDQNAPREGVRTAVSHRLQCPDRLMVTTRGGEGYADAARGEAAASVSAHLVADAALFRYGFVEALTLFLITGRDRYALHAATVAVGDTIALLIGRSGSGKSTLSYALHELGASVLGEDVGYLSLNPEVRAWAVPGRLHLVPGAARRFPVLRDRAPSLRPNGKVKLAVEIPGGDPWRAPAAARIAPVLLTPGTGAASTWRRSGPGDLGAYLSAHQESGFDRFMDQLPAVAEQLERRCPISIRLSADPHQSARTVLRALDATGGER